VKPLSSFIGSTYLSSSTFHPFWAQKTFTRGTELLTGRDSTQGGGSVARSAVYCEIVLLS